MIYSVSTANLIIDPKTSEANFPLLKQAGFGAIDLNFDTIFGKTGGTVWKKPMTKGSFYELDDKAFYEYLDGIKNAAEKNGIKIGQCHAPFPSYIFGGEKETNDNIVWIIKRTIQAAGYLNCPYIVVHPANFPYGDKATKEEIFEFNVDFYAQFIEELKKYNVVCCLENMWVSYKNKIMESTCNDYEEVNRYIEVLNDKAGGEWYAFCLDTGHAVLNSANIRFAIRTLGKNLKVLHLHEVDGVKDNHTMPFTLGAVDWDLIMDELSANNYSGTLNFEAANSWLMFPEALWGDAVKMLGAICKYFVDKYF